MTAVPPGWYPDPENPTTTRWYDGQRWTEHVGPGTQAPTPAPAPVATAVPAGFGPAAAPGGFAPAWGVPPAPVASRSPLKVALIVVGCVVGGLFVVGILAAIAIPVFLNQRVKAELADLRTVTCESVAAEAVALSRAQVSGTDVPLTSMSDLTVTDDRRTTVQRPATGGLAPVLTCTGTALWDDGATTPAVVTLEVDSALQHQVYVDWDE
ncbi:DUF2510 domain-containing protein [Cellulomonas sp.]|uniref:DUF2510 domain-containing protein n=1 Tax=Cellulomonas sp. TaxID=40001 RepID=UPI001AFFCE5A|nr:DUF2510 domain-containing protein [Cellulomonas sp.]MBO9555326.1 DUF2510 domain-containing protein [Cellulomonas sp.]